MTLSEIIAQVDSILRPFVSKLPPELVSTIYSSGRKLFLQLLVSETPHISYTPPPILSRKLWGIEFKSPLFNAAGMFKHGEGYRLVAAQGAGAYLAGTSTCQPRRGNEKNGIIHPFIAYSKSHASSNWIGLPNDGHAELARCLSRIEKAEACPVGVSVAASPGQSDKEALKGLLEGLNLFDKAGVDFIELNESCPNVPHPQNIDKTTGLDLHLIERLEFINKNFISCKRRNLPIIVKFSVDTCNKHLPALMDILFDNKFDGVNFGNTSTDYELMQKMISPDDIKLFEYFTTQFGGGVSGTPLKQKSFELASQAVSLISGKTPADEFYVIRTGGIENITDINRSESAGIALNQWFTGYFEAFARKGHRLYSFLDEY
ncbi:MAG: hypothetical protein WCT77_09730 [Bacteroidota bacterium]|jgi:dihydroorotate dehydrogenase